MTQHTPAEMREMATMHDRAENAERRLRNAPNNFLANMHRDTAAMLRQAADAMERTFSDREIQDIAAMQGKG